MKHEPTLFYVGDIIGSPFAVAADDGQRVHAIVLPELRAGRVVALSFAGVTKLVGAFLNAAVGRLAPKFSEAELTAKLTVTDMAKDHVPLFRSALYNVLSFHTNPGAHQAAWEEEGVYYG